MNRFAIVLCLAVVGLASTAAQASVVSGSYTFDGTTTPTDQSGPWNMTSTDSTYAILRFVLGEVVTFADITDLTYGYDSNLGGIGQGAPRSVFVFTDGNTATLHWGPAGSFVDGTIGDNLSTGNLAALTDVGRYDLGGSGGSAYTDRAAALALVGTKIVARISLVIDSYGGNNRNIDINSVSVSRPDGVVPEPATLFVWSLLGLTAAGVVWRKKQTA